MFSKIFHQFSFSKLPILAVFILSGPLSILAQNAVDSTQSIDLQQVTITATMATDKTPMTFTNIKKDEIRKNDFGQDVPFLLKSTPSVVETSDAGGGVGYTGIRIRGSDATRINVTIDGVPLNDAESQSVYWVDLPDFAASTSMIQIQRGVGTSTNGAGAFGASINLITNALQSKKYFNYSGSLGSFGTLKNTLGFGTGVIKNHLSVDARLSSISSDGYVDRASSKLGSVYLSALYFSDKTSLKFKIFTGNERTYQSWYGIPLSYLNDSKLRTYNPAGTEKSVESPYPNQVDDYIQTHGHLTLNHQFSPNLKANISLFLTKGKGFYEEYRADQKLKKYYSNWKNDSTTDLVRRLWLDNNFYGSVYSLTYEENGLNFTFGGGLNQYDGKHFGEVIWQKRTDLIPNFQPTRFYESTSKKTDFNIYFRTNFDFSEQLSGYVDYQYRRIGYNTEGVDRKKRDISRALTYEFFNPKFGLSFDLEKNSTLYTSLAVANREPNRSDLIDAEKANLPKPERMYDLELGWRKQFKNSALNINFYSMSYENQLVVTGNINDVGDQLRVNVGESLRAGLEIEGAVQLTEALSFKGNAAFSKNTIKNFTEYRDNWDTGGQDTIQHGTTDLAFSPNFVGNLSANYKILRGSNQNLDVTLSSKFVGAQFIDNTSNGNAQLPAYNYFDLMFLYNTQHKFLKNITFKLLINNILDQKYVNNAWTYRYNSPSYNAVGDEPYTRSEGGTIYNQTGYFPQAGRHFLVGFSVAF